MSDLIWFLGILLALVGTWGCIFYLDRRSEKRDQAKQAALHREVEILTCSVDRFSIALLWLSASLDAFNRLCEGGEKND